MKFTVQVAPEDCTGCGLCVDICPAPSKDAEGKKDPDFKAINMRPRSRCASTEAENCAFFLALPETDPARFNTAHGQGQPARAAALRVLRRLRRLRRDPLRQAADPALRRPAADRQRHGLLVDLRRQPADHALREARGRARPGLVELPLRGQRRVRARHAPGGGQLPRPGARGCSSRLSPRGPARDLRGLAGRHPRRATSRPSRRSRRSAGASPSSRSGSAAGDARGAAGCSRSPTTW